LELEYPLEEVSQQTLSKTYWEEEEDLEEDLLKVEDHLTPPIQLEIQELEEGEILQTPEEGEILLTADSPINF
jgi:hypothetical protein